MALSALAACTTWAATLSYSGYISTDSANPSTVFSGVNLSDIGSTYVLKGNMGGGYVTSPGEAGVYRASLDNGVLTVQFQKIDGTSSTGIYAKGVVVKFQQSGDDITAYASATGYSSTLTLGQDYSSSTGTPASSASAGGYGIYDVSLVAGRKVEYKNTGTTSGTYTISGGYAAQPTWKMNIPAKGTATSGALVKVKAIKIGSRTTTWTADYDSASVTVNGVSSTPISTYATPYLLAYDSSTTCKPLEYVFPNATPLMVNVGTDYDASFYKADGTQTSNNPGGSYLIKTADAVEYALRMPNVHSAGWRPVQEVETLVVATATASADENWSALTWTNGAADWTEAGATPVVLTVSENCTITLDSAVSLESIVFDIADGKTLTLSGANTITAANGIIIKGGTVSVSAANLVGTVYGDGELKFVGIRPTTTATNPSLVLTDSAWEGTVTIQYDYANTATGGNRQLFPQAWGSANSKIKWNGVAGYFGGCTSAAGWILEDLTVNDTTYPALRKNDGGSNSMTTAPSLSGSGTFADESNPSERFKFADGSSFAGSINITSSSGNGMNVQFGATAVTKVARTIHVLSGATVNVAAGKTWTAPGGIVVSGTLTVGSGASVPTITTTDTAAYVFSSSATIGTVAGSSIGSSLGIMSGTVSVTDTAITSLTIPAETGSTYMNLVTLDLSGCTSLTALYLNLGASKTVDMTKITLPDGCTVYANAGSARNLSGYSVSGATYLVEETKAEYGAGSLTVENVPTGASVAVKRVDGTIVSATVDGTTATLTSEVKIDGAATYCDATFANTVSMAYTTDNVVVRSPATGNYNNSAADKTTGIMVYDTPWLGTSDAWNIANMGDFQSDMTVAVVGQMPACKDNAMFLHIGGCNSGVNGIIIARTANDNEAFVAYNQGSTVTKLTTMTVPNADSARHVYVVTKHDTASTTTFTIYLDGIKWKTVPLDFVLAISGGVQVGSDFHGAIHPVTQTDTDGSQYVLKSITSSASPAEGYATDTTGYVNCIRIYDRILTQVEINQYSDPSEYPYVSPNGSAVRTFTAANEDWIDETENSDVWSNTKDEVTTTSGTPAAGAALTVNTDVATTIGVNLDSNVSYEAITVNGTGATFQFSGESTGKIRVAGSSVIGAPTTIVAGALDISGGPVTMTEDGSLTFDYSDYEVNSTTKIQLTGPVAQNDTAVSITVPSNPYYTYTSGWDSGSEQYVITPAVAVAVLNHEGTLTGYTTAEAAFADAVSGDTVTLQTAYLTPGTHATYAGDKTGVNVVVQGYTIAPAVADGTTTWSTSSYIWTGAGTDNNWTTPANWGLASGYPGSSGAANSQNTDNVLVPNAATITLTGSAYLTGVTLSGNLTLTGGGTLYARTISGSKVILSGATLRAYQNGKTVDANGLTVSSDVEIAAGTVNGFYMGKNNSNNYSAKFDIAGSLSGTGKVIVTIDNGPFHGLTVSGDASQFAGEWVVSGDSDATQFKAAAQVSATASYTFSSRNNNGGGSYPFSLMAGTFAVGAINGSIYLGGTSGNHGTSGMTITVGGRNEDCSFGGSIGYASSYCNNLVKTGTADMTYTGGGFYGSMTIQNGTYIIGSTDANPGAIIFQGGALSVAEGITVDPSSHFSSDSTAAVVFDDRGYDNEWATALTAADTPYGLTKKGAGTLTLSAATATIGGPTTVSEGILVVPVGTTFNGAVTVAEGAKIQFEADPNWADGATPTICTFTTAPSADTLDRIEITGFGGRQSATMEYNSETGAYVATVTSPTLVWNGANNANWTDADAWLIGETPATFQSGDKVVFSGASFDGVTEMTVSIPSDVAPASVTIDPGSGNTFVFTGAGKATTDGLEVAVSSGTAKLAADVFSGLAIANAGTVEVAESGSGVSIGDVTGSGNIKVTSGELHTTGTISATTSMSIAQGATVYVEATPGDYRTVSDALKITGAGKLVICDGATFTTAKNSSLGEFTGELRIEAGGRYNTPNGTRDNVAGRGKLTLAGGTLNGSFGGSVVSADTTLANTSLELEDGTTSSVTVGNVRLIYDGPITGGGTLNATGKAFSLQSSASSDFTGAVNFGTASNPAQHGIYSVGAGSENADYSFTGANVDGVGGVISVSGTTADAPVKLGSLAIASGTTVQNVNAGTYVEVGKNDNSTLAGTISGQTMTITKVGATSTLTLGGSFSMPSGSTIDVKGGTLVTQGTGNPAALTLSGQTLTVGANATATAQNDLVLDGGTLNVNGTVNIGNSTGALWLKAGNNAIINVDAGGNLNLCRVTADGSYTMNFDGGTLTEYGAGYGNDDVIGGTAWDTSEAHTITLNVKAGGLTVDTATATKIYPVLSGDAESVGGGLTKKGAGTLTLAAAPTFTGAITVEAGSVVLPTGDYTLGANTIVSSRDTANGTMTLAYATTVALTVPAVDGTTVAVTYVDSNGDTQTVAVSDTANVYLVPVGTEVTVTYTGTTGTVVTSGGTITGTYNEAVTVDTTGVTVASAAVWVGNAVENGDNLWSTATNWDPEGVPGQTTLVEFPAANSEYTVILTGWSPCAGMSVEGTVTVQQQSDTVNWLAIQSGAIIGDGTLKLNNIGVSNDTGATVTIAPDLVVLTTGNDGDGNGQKQTTFANGAFTFNGDVTVDGWMFTVGAVNTYNGTVTVNGRFRQVWGGENVHYRPVFNGDVVIGQGVYMDNYSDAGFEFNGGTVTGLGTGGTLHTGNGSNTKITGQGLTVAGNVVIGSGGTQTPVEAPVLMRPGSTLTIRNYVSVTSVNPVDAAYCAVTDNESSPRVFTCSWKAEAKPEIDMTAEAPVTVTTSGVTFAVSESSLIEGLYYRVKAVDGKGKESAAASTEKVKYTGDMSKLNFTALLPTDGVLYYTIEASDDE